MKNFLSLFVVLLGIMAISCSDEKPKKNDIVPEPEKEIVKKPFDTEKMTGLYMGEFGKSTILLQLNYIQGKNASGFNIVRGNRRNIKGSVENKGSHFFFTLKEPGNEKYDGRFEFEIDTSHFELKGKWIPNDPKAATLKEFSLKKTEKKDSDPDLIGDWSGNIGETYGKLVFKKDGTCSFTGSIYIEGENEDRYEEYKVSGTWIENENEIRIEFEKHKALKKSILHLKREKDKEMDMVFLKESDEIQFYPYGMYF